MVVGIFTSVRAGAPMTSLRFVDAMVGEGLRGDRYAMGVGAYSGAKRRVVRHVTFISNEAIVLANLSRGGDECFTPANTRRNIVVSLGVGELNSFVGREFVVGGVRMKGVELCDPCDRPSKICGKEGFKEAFIGRGGLRAEILTSGRIYLDDSIVVF